MSKKSKLSLIILGLSSAAAATPAFAVTLESIRTNALIAVEQGFSQCNIVGQDVGGEVPVPPVTNAERVYYRTIGAQKVLVGFYGRGYDNGSQRYFATTNGNVLGTVDSEGSNYLGFITQTGGTIAQLNTYFTTGPGGTQVRDYNGNCDGSSFTALLGQGLDQSFEQCVARAFSWQVAAAFCNL